MAGVDHNQRPAADGTTGWGLDREIRALGDRLSDVERSVRELRTQFDRVVATASAEDLHGAVGDSQGPEVSVAGAESASPPADEPPSEQIRHAARRYARLLVSEIELYNPLEVARGREDKNLYSRLKFHIERSRKAYEDKYGKSLGYPADYFQEEILRTLAQNKLELLGPDYPYRSA